MTAKKACLLNDYSAYNASCTPLTRTCKNSSAVVFVASSSPAGLRKASNSSSLALTPSSSPAFKRLLFATSDKPSPKRALQTLYGISTSAPLTLPPSSPTSISVPCIYSATFSFFCSDTTSGGGVFEIEPSFSAFSARFSASSPTLTTPSGHSPAVLSIAS